MENFDFQGKIVPLTRRKLLAKALYKDSPLAYCKKGLNRSGGYVRPKNLPLSERDMNKTMGKPLGGGEKVEGIQGVLLELWKCCRMGREFDSGLKLEIGSLYFELKVRGENKKIVQFLGELNGFLCKHNGFPEVLTPYFEEILGFVCFEYPLLRPEMEISEAECLIGVSICRFSLKKLKALRTAQCTEELALNVWVLMLILSDLDSNLHSLIHRYEDNKWDLFLQYSSNPGKLIQNIRKIPEFLKKHLYCSKIWTKAVQLSVLLNKHPEFTEVYFLITETIQFFKIVTKKQKTDGFIRKLDKKVKSCTDSARSITPASKNDHNINKIKHCRSSSRGLPNKISHEAEKRTQFLYESRFNRRLIDLFVEKLREKMRFNPDYLNDLKLKDREKYRKFKEEYIEIHCDMWIKEATIEVQKQSLDADTGDMNEAKKSAFLAFISTPVLLNPILEKLKRQIYII